MLKRSSLINSTTITATGKKTILRLKKEREISKEKKLDKIDSLENLLHLYLIMQNLHKKDSRPN